MSVYVRLASAAIQTGRYETVADLADAVKTQCARLKMPYDAHQVDHAIAVVSSRLPSRPIHQRVAVECGDPQVGKDEASRLVARIRAEADRRATKTDPGRW